jgi:hypothetical protein
MTQVFDKVWHPGLVLKIRKNHPHAYYRILESYLMHTLFQVKFKDEITVLWNIEAGISQESVRTRPISYLHKRPPHIRQQSNC